MQITNYIWTFSSTRFYDVYINVTVKNFVAAAKI